MESERPAQTCEPLSLRVTQGFERIGQALRQQSWHEAIDCKLTPTQGQVLALLQRRDKALSLNAIAEELAITAPTASDSVQTLVKKGLVSKGRMERDARSLAIELTEEGRKVATLVRAWPSFLDEAVSGLSSREQEALLLALVKLLVHLQGQTKVTALRTCITCRAFVPDAHTTDARAHHCALLDQPLGVSDLRIDCNQHQRGDVGQCESAGRVLESAGHLYA